MAIDVVTEEVAGNLEEIALATRQINPQAIRYFMGGVAVGAALGFFWGYRYNREKIRAEAFRESEEEIAQMRAEYQAKVRRAEEGTTTGMHSVKVTGKPPVEDIVEKRGYGNAGIDESVMQRPLRAPVPVAEPSSPPSADDGWDFVTELESRSKDVPYIIHQDEFRNSETGYSQVAYTFYAADDVLADEHDKPFHNSDSIVIRENLKFGHGTDDSDVVFVRNERLELEIEVCRSPKSYAEEVLGHDYDPAD